MAQIQAADGKGHYKITEIDKITPPDPNVLATTLATGKDIWIAMYVSGAAWTGSQVKSTKVIPDYTPGRRRPRHGARGLPHDRDRAPVPIHNSWGTGWGDGGYAWISEKMVQQHTIGLHHQGRRHRRAPAAAHALAERQWLVRCRLHEDAGHSGVPEDLHQ